VVTGQVDSSLIVIIPIPRSIYSQQRYNNVYPPA
jgi:hypothetical protein